MTKRKPVEPAPGPLEDYARRFDDLLANRAQREGFRRYLEGLLLPDERNKTLTALANTEPVSGAQRKEAQSLQWFLTESGWEPEVVNRRRVELMLEDPKTAPVGSGALLIDETGDRKDGNATAHVGIQYLGGIGKIANGVVSVSSVYADERLYYPFGGRTLHPGPPLRGRQDRSGLSHQAPHSPSVGRAGDRDGAPIPGGCWGHPLWRASRVQKGSAKQRDTLCTGREAFIQLVPRHRRRTGDT